VFLSGQAIAFASTIIIFGRGCQGFVSGQPFVNSIITMIRKRCKILILLALAIALLISVWLVAVAFLQVSPETDIALARNKLSDARAAGADIYSPAFFAEATAWYDSATHAWELQNDRPFFNRDYQPAISFANLSIQKSIVAAQKALTYSRNLESNLKKKLGLLEERCLIFDKQFGNLPLNNEVRHSFQFARMSLQEANAAYNNLNYLLCGEKLKVAGQEIDFIFSDTKQTLEDYFTLFGLWSDWNNQAVQYSKSYQDFSLVVSKFQKMCIVYHKGSQVAKFDIELGKNWIGDKHHKGDKTTPEGKYKVEKKKSGKQTRYFKALLLDFPNLADKQRFEIARKNGTISKHTEIGGLIEIHGEGGRGTNWTDGCIALKNDDMEWLFSRVKEGTPVFIVGSLQPLEKMISW